MVSRLRENIRRNRPELQLVQGSKETWIHTSLSFGQEALAFCCPGTLFFFWTSKLLVKSYLPRNKIFLSQTTVGTLAICCFNKWTPLLKVWLEIAGVFEPHPTYSSLELAPCGFFVFYKIYFRLKGRTFWLKSWRNLRGRSKPQKRWERRIAAHWTTVKGMVHKFSQRTYKEALKGRSSVTFWLFSNSRLVDFIISLPCR